jgi:hypothetical protein
MVDEHKSQFNNLEICHNIRRKTEIVRLSLKKLIDLSGKEIISIQMFIRTFLGHAVCSY